MKKYIIAIVLGVVLFGIGSGMLVNEVVTFAEITVKNLSQNIQDTVEQAKISKTKTDTFTLVPPSHSDSNEFFAPLVYLDTIPLEEVQITKEVNTSFGDSLSIEVKYPDIFTLVKPSFTPGYLEFFLHLNQNSLDSPTSITDFIYYTLDVFNHKMSSILGKNIPIEIKFAGNPAILDKITVS